MKKYFLVLMPIILSGCGLAEAQQKEEQSKQAYLECLENNSKKPSKCDNLMRIYIVHKQDHDRRINALIEGGRNMSASSPTVQPNMHQPQIWMQNIGGRTYSCNNIGGMVNCN
jgi:hypothetical protein